MGLPCFKPSGPTGLRVAFSNAGIVGTERSPSVLRKTLGKDGPAGDDSIVGQKGVSVGTGAAREIKDRHDCHQSEAKRKQ